jgi:hypothetical protein
VPALKFSRRVVGVFYYKMGNDRKKEKVAVQQVCCSDALQTIAFVTSSAAFLFLLVFILN